MGNIAVCFAAGIWIWGGHPPRYLQRETCFNAETSKLQETLSAGTIALEISSRNARVQAMQDRWSMLRAGVAQLMIERAADMAEAPGGGTGLLVRHYQGSALAKPA